MYASDRQAEHLDALLSEGTQTKAAKKLGVSKRSFERTLKRIRDKAAKRGFNPEHDLTHPVPEPFFVKQFTRSYDSEGKIKQSWVKGEIDSERFQSMVETTLETLCKDIKRAKPVAPPKGVISDFLNVYTISDFHLGMLAWHKEGGDDWDLKISKNLLVKAFSEMIATSPKAETCIINQLGDFMHSDSILPVTPASGHILDQDTRYDKLVETSLYLLRTLIDMSLASHNRVHLICAEGNHDTSSSCWLRHSFNALYEKDPRVTVEISPNPYYVFEHGNTMLGFHHGHKKKINDLPQFFASKFYQEWGRCRYRYGHSGHAHHEKVIAVNENNGMKWVQHPTLSAKDAYSSRNGYISDRACISFTYSKKYGERCSSYVRPEIFGDSDE
jgi:hypothetical protein